MTLAAEITSAISRATDRPFRIEQRSGVGGGGINSAEILEGGGRKYFVKHNDASRLDMFEGEAAGLDEILRSATLRVPKPVVWGRDSGQAYLVLEYLDLGGRGNSGADAALGRGLAAMHRVTRQEFGWSRNNTIGSTPQINTRETDWATFYREHRLRFQFRLAADRGAGRLAAEGERLLERVADFFREYRPVASLLHGDLWGGNHGVLCDGAPVIFDPAVYYGDRETDLAMTELFGGYGPGFYAAYREAWPLDPGYRVRRDLYNLYHVLNHFNLFGGGYGDQARRLIGTLLAETR